MNRYAALLAASGLFSVAASVQAAGLYFEEVVKTSGLSGSMLDGERRMWISGHKSREMMRESAEAAKEIAGARKGLIDMAGDSKMVSNCNVELQAIDRETEGLSKQMDGAIAGGFGSKAGKEKMLAEQRAKKEKLKADCESGDQQKIATDKAKTIGNTVDTSGKADQKASLRVLITRIDDGTIWDINSKDLVYSEISAADEKERREKKASKMQVGKGMSVAMKSIANATVAGHACNGYEIVASMNGQPLFTGQYWAAPDLEAGGDEYRNFEAQYNKTFGADPANPLMQMIYSDMDWAREYREKVASIKGLVLKKVLKLTPPDIGAMMGGAIPAGMPAGMGPDIQAKMAAAMKNLPMGMGMPSMPGIPGMPGAAAGANANPMGGPMSASFEVTKVTVGAIPDKQFELPAEVRKR